MTSTCILPRRFSSSLRRKLSLLGHHYVHPVCLRSCMLNPQQTHLLSNKLPHVGPGIVLRSLLVTSSSRSRTYHLRWCTSPHSPPFANLLLIASSVGRCCRNFDGSRRFQGCQSLLYSSTDQHRQESPSSLPSPPMWSIRPFHSSGNHFPFALPPRRYPLH